MRAPQAFVCIDIPHAPQDGLIEKQSFDSRAAAPHLRHKLLLGGFQGIEAETAERASVALCHELHAAETPRIAIAKFPSVVEHKKCVGVGGNARIGGTCDELAGHAKVDQEYRLGARHTGGFQIDNQKLAVAPNAYDAAARKVLFEIGGIFDKIGFSKTHFQDPPSRQHFLQAAYHRFDFGKLGHSRYFES
jgi:hypothetical protein